MNYSTFQWPIPPYCQWPQEAEFTGPEPVMIWLLSGRKIGGSLTRFLPAHGVIEFLPNRGRSNLDIPLADVQQLRLTRPLVIKTRSGRTEFEERGADLATRSDKQPFEIRFTNGDALQGETVGFEVHAAGLFLYLANYGDTVIRTFMPSSAIKNKQIGKRIGEILVDGKLLTSEQVNHGLARQRELREQKLGDMLTERRIIAADQLVAALQRQKAMPMVRLGEALVEMKVITPEQLGQALEMQKANRKKQIGEILVTMGFLEKADLLRALPQKLGIPTVDLSKFRIDLGVLGILPDQLIRDLKIVPLCKDGTALVVAMANPLDAVPLERVRFLTQGPVMPVMADAADIEQAIAKYFPHGTTDLRIEDLAERLRSEIHLEAVEESAVKETDNTLVRLVNQMILDAHSAGVSDIHVETNPGRKNVSIRFRKDGVLGEYLSVPSGYRAAIVSRLKIMANLDISERRRAQDGRVNFEQFGPAKVELRVAIVPTQDGLEDVVLRVLSVGEALPLSKLGLRDPVQADVNRMLQKSHGLVLVVGPTGSGKSTTLHSLVSVLNTPASKIWTAEDPVEITQAGLRQVQVNSRIGWTFAAAMRAFLRADPDIIMVGEMRDRETAEIAVEASLTGHLVFSTLHTNSAPETVTRLIEMGLDPFSFADALLGVLAQRLVRRLCPGCRVAGSATGEEISALADEYCLETDFRAEEVSERWKRHYGAPLYRYEARGCKECRMTGYHGRVGLHELMLSTPELRTLMQRRAPASELRQAALAGGMRSLRQDGIEKCLAGVTDIHEVRAAAS